MIARRPHAGGGASEGELSSGYDSAMPRPRSKLPTTERRALDQWVTKLEDADRHRKDVRADFAAWVREVGPAAVAHELGISRGAMNERLKSYEGTYKRRGRPGNIPTG